MGEKILDLGALIGVLVGGKPDQTIIIKIESQRIDASNQKIQTEVKLGLVYQVWSRNIAEKSLRIKSVHFKFA